MLIKHFCIVVFFLTIHKKDRKVNKHFFRKDFEQVLSWGFILSHARFRRIFMVFLVRKISERILNWNSLVSKHLIDSLRPLYSSSSDVFITFNWKSNTIQTDRVHILTIYLFRAFHIEKKSLFISVFVSVCL